MFFCVACRFRAISSSATVMVKKIRKVSVWKSMRSRVGARRRQRCAEELRQPFAARAEGMDLVDEFRLAEPVVQVDDVEVVLRPQPGLVLRELRVVRRGGHGDGARMLRQD